MCQSLEDYCLSFANSSPLGRQKRLNMQHNEQNTGSDRLRNWLKYAYSRCDRCIHLCRHVYGSECVHYYAAAPMGWGHYTLMDVVCPSICLSVPYPKSRIEGRSKLKIVRKEAHDTADPRLHSEVDQGYEATKRRK